MDNNLIKVLFITNNASSGGGSAVLLSQIVNRLVEDDRYSIGVFEITHWDIKPEKFDERIQVFPPYTYLNSPDRAEKMYYVYHEWNKVINENIPTDYDIYIAFNYLKPSFLLPPNKKNIVWMHGDVYDLINKYPGQKDMSEERELLRMALNKVDTIVAINENTAQSIKDVYPEHKKKIRIIENAIDIERVRKLSNEEINVKLKKPAIISVGRLDVNKNPLRLFNIYRKIHDRDKKVNLYYLGYGNLEQELRNKIYEYKLQDSVKLLGFCNNPFPIIKQADVIGMFSKSEGSPLCILEALALNVPFVSTPVGFMSIAANGNTCGKITDNNEEAANHLLSYIYMDSISKDKACRESVNRFSFDMYLEKIKRLLNEVWSKQ